MVAVVLDYYFDRPLGKKGDLDEYVHKNVEGLKLFEAGINLQVPGTCSGSGTQAFPYPFLGA